MPGRFELTPEQEKELEERMALEEASEKKYGVKKWRTEKQNQADQKRRKAFAGHKLIFPSTTDAVNEIQHEMVFGSIRSQVFQKLLFVDFMMRDSKSPLHLELSKIYRECNLKNADRKHFDAEDLVYYLKPEHVMKLIGCNRRTAIEYVEVLNHFHSKMPYFFALDFQRYELEKEGKSYYDIYSAPSSLAQHYPAGEEGADNNRPPPPLPTWFYRLVMEK